MSVVRAGSEVSAAARCDRGEAAVAVSSREWSVQRDEVAVGRRRTRPAGGGGRHHVGRAGQPLFVEGRGGGGELGRGELGLGPDGGGQVDEGDRVLADLVNHDGGQDFLFLFEGPLGRGVRRRLRGERGEAGAERAEQHDEADDQPRTSRRYVTGAGVERGTARPETTTLS